MAILQNTQPPLSQNAMIDLLCTIMILCRGVCEAGNPCWAYMCIKPSMAKSFKEAREKGPFDIEEYGAIIESGEGLEPPDEVKRRMEHEYGMNHNYEDDLLRAIERINQAAIK
jgi:hypothetical protein